MRSFSWSAITAAILALLALSFTVIDAEDEAVVFGLAAITFALLSHRDE